MKLKAPLFHASQNLSVRHAHTTTAAPIAAQMNSAIDPPDDNPLSDAIWNPMNDPAMPTSALVTRTRLPPAICLDSQDVRGILCISHPTRMPIRMTMMNVTLGSAKPAMDRFLLFEPIRIAF